MDANQTLRVVEQYEGKIEQLAMWPRFREDGQLMYLAEMFPRMRVFLTSNNPEDWDKVNRWLGFVQGILYCKGIYTIDEMRSHNRTERSAT